MSIYRDDKITHSQLTEKIIIRSQTLTPDGEGGYTRAWVKFVDTYAQISAASGSEKFEHDQIQSPQSINITVRNLGKNKQITTAMVIVWKDESYNIRSIAPTSDRSLYRTFTAEKGVAI